MKEVSIGEVWLRVRETRREVCEGQELPCARGQAGAVAEEVREPGRRPHRGRPPTTAAAVLAAFHLRALTMAGAGRWS